MRVLIAPDKFAGTLTAVEAADAIAAGWREQRPDDELDCAPMADGGPGFVDVLHAALGGELLATTVAGPTGRPVPATILLVGDTAYVESAQACGLHLTGREGAESATTLGVGQLVAAALDGPATTIVVGLGGSGTNDGGAGLLAALGATADTPLDAGAAGLDGIGAVDLEPAAHATRGRPAGRRDRRGQPPHRAVRRHQGLRSAEGHPRGAAARGGRVARAARGRGRPPYRPWRRAPAPPEASASRCWRWERCGSPGSAWWPRRCGWRSGPGWRTWW